MKHIVILMVPMCCDVLVAPGYEKVSTLADYGLKERAPEVA